MAFRIFPMTNWSCNTCITALDTPVRRNQSDAVSEQNCCNGCQFILLPLFFTYDVISLPIRGVVHLFKK